MKTYKFELLLDKVGEIIKIGTLLIVEGGTSRTYKWEYETGLPQDIWWANLQGLDRVRCTESDVLFSWFQDRIPPKSRRDWQERLGMEVYDEVYIIRRTGLRLVEDTFYMREVI